MVTVVMMGEMSLDEKKNDQDKVDGMWQEVYRKVKRCLTK